MVWFGNGTLNAINDINDLNDLEWLSEMVWWSCLWLIKLLEGYNGIPQVNMLMKNLWGTWR